MQELDALIARARASEAAVVSLLTLAQRLHNDVSGVLGQALLLQASFNEGPETGIMLDVPWVGQLGQGAGYAAGDCGPAVLAQWLLYNKAQVSVDDVSKATGLPRGFRFTTFTHLKHAAAHWGLTLQWKAGQSIQALQAQLEGGQPVIVLVYYPAIPQALRYDPNYPYSHWLLVTGISDDRVYYNDPYFRDEVKGLQVSLSVGTFTTAWNQNHKAGNYYSDGAMISKVV